MSKYRIRLKTGRVIGPFDEKQLHELRAKGHIQGKEEAQIFPTGNWAPISSFDFFSNLMDENKTNVVNHAPKEDTFIIDLSKIRNEKNIKEIEKIDIEEHTPVESITETIQIQKTDSKPRPVETNNTKFELELDQLIEKNDDEEKNEVDLELDNLGEDTSDKTALNPIAQQDLARLKKLKEAEEKRIKDEEERKNRELEERRKSEQAIKLIEADESTQMIVLDQIKHELIQVAQEEEKAISKAEKDIKKKKRKEEEAKRKEEDDEEENEELEKKKKLKKYAIIGGFLLFIAFMFPNDDKPQKPPFVHVEPVIEFPVPFDKADNAKAQVDYQKALIAFSQADYPNLVKAGQLLKSAYENNIEDENIIGMLVRVYAEQLKYSREDKQTNAQIIFNLIQAKRPFLAKNANGVIGMNIFYMTIQKPEAAADVVSKYLKLYPKNVTEDLFAVYLNTLLKLGRLDMAKQFSQALLKAPKKNRYTLDSLILLSELNQENEKVIEYIDEGIKTYPNLVGFYLRRSFLYLKDKKLNEAQKYLQKVEDLNFEQNEIDRAQFFEILGMLLAAKGDVKTATEMIKKSLAIDDSNEMRMRLADLQGSDDPQNETDKLIAESKAIKLLIEAKDFFEKRSYELALSYAARATDVLPGFIPAELYLAKVQLRLGLAKQALLTLENLVKKYPDDQKINLALIDAYIETYKFYDAKNRIGVLSGTDFKHSYEFASLNGRLYLKMGDPLQAINWFRNSMSINPLNDKDIYLLAELLIKRANFDAAKVLLNKCMELDPTNIDYRISYSKIVYEQQDDLAAIGYLLGLMEEFGENPKVMAEIAIFYYRAGKIKDFQAYKEKLEKLPTKDKSLYEFLIKAALLDERFNEIPDLVENLLRIEPGELEAMMTVGRVLFEDGKLIEAAKWFKRLQDKLETYPKVKYYIAKIKYLSKDYDEALKDIELDLKANGDNDADLCLMAQIYVEKGDLVTAENLFKRAQKINPKAFDSLVGLADISTKRNNFDLALDLYKKAMKEKTDEPVVHKKIGDVYRLLGQGALAVEAYKLYLEMNPEASDKAQIESYINLMQ